MTRSKSAVAPFDVVAAAEALRLSSRAAQGLPATVTDEAVLARVVVLSRPPLVSGRGVAR